jgi:hypothetical protein
MEGLVLSFIMLICEECCVSTISRQHLKKFYFGF